MCSLRFTTDTNIGLPHLPQGLFLMRKTNFQSPKTVFMLLLFRNLTAPGAFLVNQSRFQTNQLMLCDYYLSQYP